jgi:hypothetical protein
VFSEIRAKPDRPEIPVRAGGAAADTGRICPRPASPADNPAALKAALTLSREAQRMVQERRRER